MKSFLPLLSFTIIITSCSTAYKSGQTPDDVYFSPQRPQEEYVRTEKDDDRYYQEEERNDVDRNRNDYYSYDDRYLRMKVRNRQRWNNMDNDFYSYNPYIYRNYNNYYNNPWNSFSYWDYYYNPYSSHVIMVNPKSPVYNRPRTTNLRVFNSPQLDIRANNPNYKMPASNNSNNRTRSAAPRRDIGNDLRTIFGGSNDNSTSTPRSSVPSSNNNSSNSNSSGRSSGNSGSSSGSSGGNAPARRF